jgi:hypothetical protein
VVKNITLAVPEETLREVRKIAAERETTVNALVREYLEHLAAHKQRRARLRRELEAFAQRTSAEVGDVTWSREDAHER